MSNAGIILRSISEGIDFDSKYGKAILGMMAVMAELEKDIIGEQTIENKITKSKKGIPAVGPLPYGRTYDREKDEWGLEEGVKPAIEWAAKQYIAGESLQDIAPALKPRFDISISYGYLLRVFKELSGDTWAEHYEGEEPIIHDIPPLLDKKAIEKIDRELKKLVRLVLDEKLDEDTTRETEQELKKVRAQTVEELKEKEEQLRNLPDPDKVRQQAKEKIGQILEHYESPDRLEEMTFKEKKQLLHLLFDGTDKDDKEYGIYVTREGKRKNSFIEFSLYGGWTKDFDSDTEDGDIDNNGGTSGGSQSGSPKESRGSNKGQKFYKTSDHKVIFKKINKQPTKPFPL